MEKADTEAGAETALEVDLGADSDSDADLESYTVLSEYEREADALQADEAEEEEDAKAEAEAEADMIRAADDDDDGNDDNIADQDVPMPTEEGDNGEIVAADGMKAKHFEAWILAQRPDTTADSKSKSE